MTTALLVLAVFLSAVVIALEAVLLHRGKKASDLTPLQNRLDVFQSSLERLERTLRDELVSNRSEAAAQAGRGRQELTAALGQFGQTMQSQMTSVATLQKNQLDSFAKQLDTLTQNNTQQLEAVRAAIDAKLRHLQEDNAKQLEQMRATVDEKLQGTLEKRLGESFKQVSERLEQVHKGLGEMQTLAAGVGDLKKTLSNVKTRGILGEVQLGMLLEEMLTSAQFSRNVKTRETGGETVEFVINLPGQSESGRDPVWLPIDAKFPVEDYHRLVDALDKGDADAIVAAGAGLESRIKSCARDIHDKYLNPPKTTDFGVMFLPTEGLYAEVARRTDLVETIRRNWQIIVAGPSTFAALLSSLQMGFRTLAIQQRSSEVWKVLGAVKTEFGKFGDTLESVRKKLEQATSTMDDAAKRTRAIERKLRGVEEVPALDAQGLLQLTPEEPDPES